MARKLSNIENEINNKSDEFYTYFYQHINESVIQFIETLKKQTNVFIFSGIIRDFFIKSQKDLFRDIDIIIEDDLKIELLFDTLTYKKNSFGGYKITIDTFTIDLWVIKKTWALNNGQLKFEFDFIHELPKTTFFNFSSIIYSLNNKEFIIGQDFLRFIRDKKIEIVSDKNLYPELCIVNSFYYQERLNLQFGEKLKNYITSNIQENIEKLESIQIKHFKKIKYTKEYLIEQIEKMK